MPEELKNDLPIESDAENGDGGNDTGDEKLIGGKFKNADEVFSAYQKVKKSLDGLKAKKAPSQYELPSSLKERLGDQSPEKDPIVSLMLKTAKDNDFSQDQFNSVYGGLVDALGDVSKKSTAARDALKRAALAEIGTSDEIAALRRQVTDALTFDGNKDLISAFDLDDGAQLLALSAVTSGKRMMPAGGKGNSVPTIDEARDTFQKMQQEYFANPQKKMDKTFMANYKRAEQELLAARKAEKSDNAGKSGFYR